MEAKKKVVDVDGVRGLLMEMVTWDGVADTFDRLATTVGGVASDSDSQSLSNIRADHDVAVDDAACDAIEAVAQWAKSTGLSDAVVAAAAAAAAVRKKKNKK